CARSKATVVRNVRAIRIAARFISSSSHAIKIRSAKSESDMSPARVRHVARTSSVARAPPAQHTARAPTPAPHLAPSRNEVSAGISKDVPAQILVLQDAFETLPDVPRIDDDLAPAHLGCVEGDLVEESLEDRVQAAGADVLGARVHVGGDARDLADG